MSANLKRLKEDYERSRQRLLDAVRRAYPKDRVYRAVTNHAHEIDARIIGYGRAWSDPEELWIENVKTGGRHRVPFWQVSLPQEPTP